MNEIIQGDCLEVMKTLEPESVDCIITDPPYGIDFCSSRTNRKERIANDKINDWEIMLPKMLIEFKRIIKFNGCCCCCCGGGGKTPVTAIFTLEAIKHFNLIQTLVWKKTIGVGWKYRPSYENIIVLSKSKDDYNFYDCSKKCSNVIEGINTKIPKENEHPTVKPVKLMRHLIEIHSKKGDLILDPFCGSGTTCVAAKELNRNYIGIELNPEYCAIAERRLAHTERRLF